MSGAAPRPTLDGPPGHRVGAGTLSLLVMPRALRQESAYAVAIGLLVLCRRVRLDPDAALPKLQTGIP